MQTMELLAVVVVVVVVVEMRDLSPSLTSTLRVPVAPVVVSHLPATWEGKSRSSYVCWSEVGRWGVA